MSPNSGPPTWYAGGLLLLPSIFAIDYETLQCDFSGPDYSYCSQVAPQCGSGEITWLQAIHLNERFGRAWRFELQTPCAQVRRTISWKSFFSMFGLKTNELQKYLVVVRCWDQENKILSWPFKLRKPSWNRSPINWWDDPLQSLFVSMCYMGAMAIGTSCGAPRLAL